MGRRGVSSGRHLPPRASDRTCMRVRQFGAGLAAGCHFGRPRNPRSLLRTAIESLFAEKRHMARSLLETGRSESRSRGLTHPAPDGPGQPSRETPPNLRGPASSRRAFSLWGGCELRMGNCGFKIWGDYASITTLTYWVQLPRELRGRAEVTARRGASIARRRFGVEHALAPAACAQLDGGHVQMGMLERDAKRLYLDAAPCHGLEDEGVKLRRPG